IAVWVTQTCASMPPITTCPRPLFRSSCRRSRKTSFFTQENSTLSMTEPELPRASRSGETVGPMPRGYCSETVTGISRALAARRVRHRRQELLLHVDDEQL